MQAQDFEDPVTSLKMSLEEKTMVLEYTKKFYAF